MKKLLYILILCVSCGTPTIPENDLIKANLTGNIETVMTLSFDNEISGKLIIDGYNKEGYLISKRRYELDRNFTKRDLSDKITGDIYTYEEIEYEGIGKGYFQDKNEEGKLVFTGRKQFGLIMVNSKIKMRIIYNYDRSGNLIEKKYVDQDDYYDNIDVIKTKHIFKYDKKDNLIEKKIFSSDSNNNLGLVKRFTYDYDVYGNKIEENFFDSNGMLFFNIKYENDDKGNVINEIFYAQNGKFVSTYQYYYYNEKKQKGAIFPISFDKYNNWNRKLSSKKDIVERIIKYY